MLLTRTHYNVRGEAFESLDPKGIVQRSDYDAAGRTVRTIQNYVPGSADADADANLTVEMTYNADGRQATLTAVNPSTGNQTTRYEYGVSPATGSKLSSNDLLRETVYPDAGLDTVRYRYNRQGQRIGMTDQNGTAHAYAYDQLGRMTADEVTALGTGIDGAVRRLRTTYEVRGLVEKLTSYNAANGVVNEVKNEYNGLAQLTKQCQSHAGAVTGGTPFVEYTYDLTASAGVFTKGARPTATIYPTNTQQRELDYGTAGEAGDKLARPVGITDGDTKRCNYEYVGLRRFVRVEYLSEDETVAFLTYELSSGNHYIGWDQYGRIVDHHWRKPLEDEEFETLDRFQYGYDANSNRLYKANLTARALDKPFDELYRYDRVNRLVDFERGTLIGAYTQIVGTPTKKQTWDLDPTGNWSRFTSADDGELETDQTRIHNPANEITQLSSWFPPAYDHAGSMTKMPKPEAPAEGFVCTYDAWNRLVRVQDADECGCPAEIVSEYQYDAQTWRTVAVTYDEGEPDETRHFYYSSEWQILEERLESLLTPERTHLWGLRYIDEIVHRWRDSDGDGDLDESIWAIQDANWNVDALIQDGIVVVRLVYAPYTLSRLLSATYTDTVSAYEHWLLRYSGYCFDATCRTYYARYRHLHPDLGLWLSRDPIWNGSSPASGSVDTAPRDSDISITRFYSTSNYAFDNARPINDVDPMGLDALSEDELQELKGCACQAVRFTLRPTNPPTPQTTIPRGVPGVARCKDGKWVGQKLPNADYIGMPDKNKQYIACGFNSCTSDHENHHVLQAEQFCPKACANVACGWDMNPQQDFAFILTWPGRCLSAVECYAYLVSIACIIGKIHALKMQNNLGCVQVGKLGLDIEVFTATNTYGCKLPKALMQKIDEAKNVPDK